MEKLERKIVDLISYHSGYKKEKITPETGLLDDVGMDGDDSWEFFEDFSNKFNVDLGSMQYDRHFGPEGFTPLQGLLFFPRVAGFLLVWIFSFFFPKAKPILNRFTPLMYPFSRDMEPVTVQDLVDAAKAGKWVMYYPPPLKKN